MRSNFIFERLLRIGYRTSALSAENHSFGPGLSLGGVARKQPLSHPGELNRAAYSIHTIGREETADFAPGTGQSAVNIPSSSQSAGLQPV